MDNWRALHTFWAGFDVPAYDEQTIFAEDDSPAYPHITYESFSGTWETSRTMSAHLWDRSTSWKWLKEKAEDIKNTIGNGMTMNVDDGVIWFRIPEYTPFAQVIASGSEDDLVKRILLNIEVEFLTVR